MKQPKEEQAGKHGGRPQATRLDYQRDPYAGPSKSHAEKPAEPAVCRGCKAIYREGRWAWPDVPSSLVPPHSPLCPACKRIQDRNPAGEVRIRGDFARSHRAEILARVHHVEEREKAERPLIRIMAVEEADDSLTITTTDVHLAHAIGTALHDAFKGSLHAPWSKEGSLARVTWER